MYESAGICTNKKNASGGNKYFLTVVYHCKRQVSVWSFWFL